LSEPCAAPQCDRPKHNGYHCATCVATLRRDLSAIPDLIADLMTTISRQDKIGDQTGPRGSERPLPLRLGPMEGRRDLADTLANWAMEVHGGIAQGNASVGGAFFVPARLAAYLLDHLLDITAHPDAGDCADEIGYAVITAQRAIDKPLQAQYAGPCEAEGCGADLYARLYAREVVCRN
jgi:hypothetical protein